MKPVTIIKTIWNIINTFVWLLVFYGWFFLGIYTGRYTEIAIVQSLIMICAMSMIVVPLYSVFWNKVNVAARFALFVPCFMALVILLLYQSMVSGFSWITIYDEKIWAMVAGVMLAGPIWITGYGWPYIIRYYVRDTHKPIRLLFIILASLIISSGFILGALRIITIHANNRSAPYEDWIDPSPKELSSPPVLA